MFECAADSTDDVADTDTDTDTGTTDSGAADDGMKGFPPALPTLEWTPSQVKKFNFSWDPTDAQYYRLFERIDVGLPYVDYGAPIYGTSISVVAPIFLRASASYLLKGCNEYGCVDSNIIDVAGNTTPAIGYFKAPNAQAGDRFCSVALSGDGTTLAVGAPYEDSDSDNVGGDMQDESAPDAGAVYVYSLDMRTFDWSEPTYIKAPFSDSQDGFGGVVALSADGQTLAISAPGEQSNSAGVNGDQQANALVNAGAVYVYRRSPSDEAWGDPTYIKAPNPGPHDFFGGSLSLSGDGSVLVVGANGEDSSSVGIGGDMNNELANNAGAAYIYQFDPMTREWSHVYLKALNTDSDDYFGSQVAISADGRVVAVGAPLEGGAGKGTDSDPLDNTAPLAGAVYVYNRTALGTDWEGPEYIKAPNTDEGDYYGISVALSASGDTLAVGAYGEDSYAIGVGGNADNNSLNAAGAVYVYQRDRMTSQWGNPAYLKASNPGILDWFGVRVTLSGDGDMLVVAAWQEDGGSKGVGGLDDDLAQDSGAVYVFVRDPVASEWQFPLYVKAPTVDSGDAYHVDFGYSSKVALSADGGTLAIGMAGEDGGSTLIGGVQSDNSAANAGAVYVY